jgi:hypothetical protein
MASSIEIKADINAAGKAVHSVVVTIDNDETIFRFASKEDAERFAQQVRAGLAKDEKIASRRVREIAYHLWQEEGAARVRRYGIGLRPRPISIRRPIASAMAVVAAKFGGMAPGTDLIDMRKPAEADRTSAARAVSA